MVEGNLFEGIYYEKDGHRKNVGFIKAYKRNGLWHINADIRGLYDYRDWIDVNYIVNTEAKSYSFQLGKMEIINGVGREEFVLNAGSFLPDYGFEKADGITFGDWKDSDIKAYWGNVESIAYENIVTAAELQTTPSNRTYEQEMPAQAEKEIAEPIPKIPSKKQQEMFEKIEDSSELDIFADDEYENFLEVSPEQLKEFTALGENIASNSFLLHAYYKYHHILVARPTDPKKENLVFIGAPGVYCNRERYLASLFGLRNFKKSHRSDYTNPNFGYWYAEMYI